MESVTEQDAPDRDAGSPGGSMSRVPEWLRSFTMPKTKKSRVIGAALLVLFIVTAYVGPPDEARYGTAEGTTEARYRTAEQTTDQTADVEITAEMLVDYMEAAGTFPPTFCGAYATVGYDLGLVAFESTWTESSMSAEEAYAEMVSRC